MSTVGKILGAAGIATGVLGAAALGGVTAQRMSVRKYQSAHTALVTDPGQQDGYGSLKADRTYSVDTDDGVALHVEEVGPVTAPITVIFSHGWTLRSGAWPEAATTETATRKVVASRVFMCALPTNRSQISFVFLRQFSVHSVRDIWSLTKTRLPETAG